MSLDVYLKLPEPVKVSFRTRIFVRENGQTIEITREEWDKRYPGRDPVVSVHNENTGSTVVYSANITHNLADMAKRAGIYEHLWRPGEIGITKAKQLIEPLTIGVALMKCEPQRFIALNPENGWGSYSDFLPWIERYIMACEEFPGAEVSVWR